MSRSSTKSSPDSGQSPHIIEGGTSSSSDNGSSNDRSAISVQVQGIAAAGHGIGKQILQMLPQPPPIPTIPQELQHNLHMLRDQLTFTTHSQHQQQPQQNPQHPWEWSIF